MKFTTWLKSVGFIHIPYFYVDLPLSYYAVVFHKLDFEWL